MTQKISYHIRFTFPAGEEQRERMLPSIDLFLRAFEEADRLIAGSLGLELDYHRALKEMSESYFYYHITLKLSWPNQILLGAWPEPASLRNWMNMARNDLFGSAGTDGVVIDEIAERWDKWARIEGLADALLYTAPPSEKLEPLLDDLGTALSTLGGDDAVTLD
ncbi:MAG: hypothetical protein J7L76_01495 [Spirochaetaceae bacterium]|nr:hypothetical protein [Spirochaetaceae bacterium]RKX75318.1 MAG: hypothetical protein DRP49_04820 [Spirochaetota bacterium]